MKVIILLPGYLDSPNYTHFEVFDRELTRIGYSVIRVDPCHLWSGGNSNDYTLSNYLQDIKDAVATAKVQNPEEIILLGHSLGGFLAIIAGEQLTDVARIIALCPPASYMDSPQKWKDRDVRISTRNLPGDLSQEREFRIPKSFSLDAQNYDATEIIAAISKPLMILIGLEDTVVPPAQTELLVQRAQNPYVIRMEDMDHDFRNSEEKSLRVLEEIKKFLSK